MWETEEMRTAVVLEGFHRRAITTVKFSPDGRLLASMGADDHHKLAVYDWENSVILCTTRSERRHIIRIACPFASACKFCSDETIRKVPRVQTRVVSVSDILSGRMRSSAMLLRLGLRPLGCVDLNQRLNFHQPSLLSS